VDRRRRILVNNAEALTDAALREAATDLGFRIDAKVRLADAVDIDRSGLSDDAYRYALRAHLDWVVSDLDTTRAEFAVEFDGASHDTPDARRRDATKNEVCDRLGLPILRVDAAVLRPAAQRTVLGVLLETWAAWRAFNQAQDTGTVPEDEPFNAYGFVNLDPDTGDIVQPLDFTAAVRKRIRRMAEAGVLTHRFVATAYRGGISGEPAEGYAWVYTTDDRVVVGHARARDYSFPAVLPSDLADSLAHLDLGDRLARWREGDETIPLNRTDAEARLPRIGSGSDWSGGGGG
jgi:very-short-patch-repair endonuclease